MALAYTFFHMLGIYQVPLPLSLPIVSCMSLDHQHFLHSNCFVFLQDCPMKDIGGTPLHN